MRIPGSARVSFRLRLLHRRSRSSSITRYQGGKCMSRLRAIGFAAGLLATSAVFAAGPVDMELEAGAWRSNISGDVRDRGGDIDVKSILGLGDETAGFVRARLHVMALGNL